VIHALHNALKSHILTCFYLNILTLKREDCLLKEGWPFIHFLPVLMDVIYERPLKVRGKPSNVPSCPKFSRNSKGYPKSSR
jgi:hypothetical protein